MLAEAELSLPQEVKIAPSVPAAVDEGHISICLCDHLPELERQRALFELRCKSLFQAITHNVDKLYFDLSFTEGKELRRRFKKLGSYCHAFEKLCTHLIESQKTHLQALTFRSCQIARALKQKMVIRDRFTARGNQQHGANMYGALPIDVQKLIAMAMPICQTTPDREQEVRKIYAIWKVLYSNREQLFIKTILPTWVESSRIPLTTLLPDLRAQDLWQIAPQLSFLNLEGCSYTSIFQTMPVHKMGKLRSLNISRLEVGRNLSSVKGFIDNLSLLTNLNALDFSQPQNIDASSANDLLERLSCLTALKELHIWGWDQERISEPLYFGPLRHLNLRTFDFSDNRPPSARINAWDVVSVYLTGLENLTYRSSNAWFMGVQDLAHFPYLTSLTLRLPRMPLVSCRWGELASFTQLKRLQLISKSPIQADNGTWMFMEPIVTLTFLDDLN
jgi:hypothetical protein